VRCAGQDDDPHSGSRGKLTRVKPGELSPVLRDEKKLPERLPCSQGNLSQPSHRQTIDKQNKAIGNYKDTAKKRPTPANFLKKV
jgi:hypothetical protein